MSSFFFKKIAQGLGSLLKKGPRKEELPTKVEDLDILDAPLSQELVTTPEIQKQQVDVAELKRIARIKKDANDLKFATERNPLQKITPKDPTYIQGNDPYFTRGLVQDFDKGSESILPRASVLREQIIAHPNNEPLSPKEWVKWIQKRMNKSVNYSNENTLNKMDLSIKQTEIDDANLFKTKSQFSKEVLQAIDIGDDPEVALAIDKFRQRYGQKEAKKYLDTIKKDLKQDVASGKNELVGGYLKAAQDQGKKISKQELIKVVENNPLYHGRLTHLKYDDRAEGALEGGLDKIEKEYLNLQKYIDDTNEELSKFLETDNDFKLIESKDALGKTVQGYSKKYSKKLKDQIEKYQADLKKISNQISTVDVKSKFMMDQPLDVSGVTVMDNMYSNKLRKVNGGRLDGDITGLQGSSARNAVQQIINSLGPRQAAIEQFSFLNQSIYPKKIAEGPEILSNVFSKLRELEEKTIKGYLKKSKENLYPGYRNYVDYVVGGEQKYGEIVFNIPEHNKNFFNAVETNSQHMGASHLGTTNQSMDTNFTQSIRDNVSEKGGKMPRLQDRVTRLQVNPVYFSRYTTQKLDNGDSVIMINELQSDFGQNLRRLKEEGIERINPYNTEFFSGAAEEGAYVNQKLQDIQKRLEGLDDVRMEKGLLTDPQNKEYRELLLDAMVEEKKFKKGFSGEQKDMLSAYKTTNQEKRYPYLPLSSMQGVSDHAVKTYAKVASKDLPEVTHIAVYPVEFLHARKRGLDKAPNFIQYGTQQGKAGVKDAEGTIGLPSKSSTLIKAMEKFAKDYGIDLEKRLVSRSDPDKPYKLVYKKGSREDNNINQGRGKKFFPKMKNYEEHYASFATDKEAIRALRVAKKINRGISLKVIDKLKDGKPNPELYDEMITLPIPNDMLDLPTKGYFKGGLVRSGFKW